MTQFHPNRAKKIVARFYVSGNGSAPVREWLLGLDQDDRRTVGKDIQKVEFGWPIGMPYCRPLGRGLWEVRSDISSGRIARTIFCIADGGMILLHAFVKKTQKTPQQEIDLALKRMKELD
ncbi:type II toxin-antitoxin system RelE/ParE family toxin [Leptolyngbya sp. 15MV]|nr:type II toxin-antitoxin system RelE/ParE family toxin [Leptolyngbya sp. 15MV]